MRFMVVGIMLCLAAAATAATHETDVGAVEIGGMLDFHTASGDLYEYDGDNLTSFTINPQAAYFVSPNFSLGLNLSYTKIGYNSSDDMTIFGIGPVATYYFAKPDAGTAPFIGAGYFYQKTTTEGDVSSSSVQIVAGVLIKLVPHFGMKAGMYYSADDSENISGNRIGALVGFTGFLY